MSETRNSDGSPPLRSGSTSAEIKKNNINKYVRQRAGCGKLKYS